MTQIFPDHILSAAREVAASATEKRLRIATAESCTGGLLSACITEMPGVSHVFDRGFVTYSNDAKMAQLSVERKTLTDFGAVSRACAMEMAEGALGASHADIAVAITGVAGPGGGTEDKPVGLVYIAVVTRKDRDNPVVMQNEFSGTRGEIRMASVEVALRLLKEEIRNL